MTLRIEDQVREYPREVLGFKRFSDKSDGWYLPKNMNDVAIILETKSEDNKNCYTSCCRVISVRNLDGIFTPMSRQASATYNLDSDGVIALGVDESNRA